MLTIIKFDELYLMYYMLNFINLHSKLPSFAGLSIIDSLVCRITFSLFRWFAVYRVDNNTRVAVLQSPPLKRYSSGTRQEFSRYDKWRSWIFHIHYSFFSSIIYTLVYATTYSDSPIDEGLLYFLLLCKWKLHNFLGFMFVILYWFQIVQNVFVPDYPIPKLFQFLVSCIVIKSEYLQHTQLRYLFISSI